MDYDDEAYILLLLSDGNLPTGSFVASAGLESFVTHGFLTPIAVSAGKNDKLERVVDFVRDNLNSYARSALPFLSDAHNIVQQKIASPADTSNDLTSAVLHDLHALDNLFEAMTLNHVARRASKTQGVAILSLYSKGFIKPPVLREPGNADLNLSEGDARDKRLGTLVDKLKLAVRREETHGHLPVCWGVLTAALGLSLERSQFVHLFLYARGLLSAGVRMNTLGPYAAQQLLLHVIRPLVVAETKQCAALRTGLKQPQESDDPDTPTFDEETLTYNGPAMTWPLGEILAARHDLQHSRVFNS